MDKTIVTFTWDRGNGDKVKEVKEFDENSSDDDIQIEYEEWVLDKIGHNFSWFYN